MPCEDRCDGCCTASDECIEPAALSTEQCGEQGESCFGCDEDSECVDGTCISSACLAECDGCCDGDTCLGGLEAQACGQDGAVCESCAAGTMCDGTGCAPDPASLWDLVVLNATVAPTNASMVDWDAFGGLPDPYVRITIDGETQETAEVGDTLLPAWNETIFDGLTVETLQDSWSVSMVDADAVFDEIMQTCTTTIPPYGFGYALTASCGDGDYVYWTLTIATVLSSD
ncbi:MAG: hypothetical protein JKY87_06015 [Mariprofundus sp.]|nr:hypothetical protein [Mariprofundus sp.]